MNNRGEVVAYYALFKMADGGGNFLVMSKEDIENHAKKFSQAFKGERASGPWKTDFDSMAKKTVIKQLLKYAPIAVELRQAIATDETVKNVDVNKLDEVNVLDVEPEFEFEIPDEEPFKEQNDSDTASQESRFNQK